MARPKRLYFGFIPSPRGASWLACCRPRAEGSTNPTGSKLLESGATPSASAWARLHHTWPPCVAATSLGSLCPARCLLRVKVSMASCRTMPTPLGLPTPAWRTGRRRRGRKPRRGRAPPRTIPAPGNGRHHTRVVQVSAHVVVVFWRIWFG